jgi:hypothetical protein
VQHAEATSLTNLSPENLSPATALSQAQLAAIFAALGLPTAFSPDLAPESLPPDTRFTRLQLAKVLTAFGFPTSPGALSTLASRGGGPPYDRYGRYSTYRWGPSISWARERCKPAGASTSERDVARAKPQRDVAPSKPQRGCAATR